MSAAIRGYIAASLDGYVATPDGGVAWLEPFQQHDFGYDAFAAQIGTFVMGRATYDQVRAWGVWPYAGKPVVLLTSRPVDDPPPGVRTFAGPVAGLVPELRAATGGDVWVVGGARVQRDFLDAGALDRIEVFVMPLLLGDGIPLWPRSTARHRLALRAADTLAAGVVRLDYAITLERAAG